MVSVKNSALKEILKSRGVKNYSSANKEALVKMVEASGGMPSAAPAPAPAPEAVPEPAPKSPKKSKKVKVTEVDVACNDVEVVEPVKKVKKTKKDKSPSPEKKPATKKAKAELKVEV
jgi:hypothetical protein